VSLEVASTHHQMFVDDAFEVVGRGPQSSMHLQIVAVVQIYASHWQLFDNVSQCQGRDSSAPLQVLFQVAPSVEVGALHFAVLFPETLPIECTQAS